MREILVGIDGSPGADAALSWAAEQALATGSSVWAVHVFHPPMLAVGLRVASVPGGVLEEAASAAREEVLRLADGEWVAPLREAGVGFKVEVREGSPGRVLVELAGTEGVRAVVVGRRGHGELTDLVLGSVGHHLVHHSHIPVVIVPAP
jgi:nucleotide-binding universal stress UspA family protein